MRRLCLLSAVLACACAPRLYVNVLQPAPVNLGPVKKLAVLESQGRQTAREQLLEELQAQAKSAGYFTLADRTGEGITVRITGQSVLASAPPASDEVGLRVDVVEWNAEKESQPTRDKDPQGNPVMKEVWKGRVQVLLTAFSASGTVHTVEKEYKAQGEDEKDEDAAILAAARDVVTHVLEDLTPTYAQKAIQLDDTEDAQRPVIDTARDADLPKAIAMEREILAKTPNNAAANFNLAVMLDAQGLYRDALGHYERAVALADTNELYRETKAACAQRLADAEALGN